MKKKIVNFFSKYGTATWVVVCLLAISFSGYILYGEEAGWASAIWTIPIAIWGYSIGATLTATNLFKVIDEWKNLYYKAKSLNEQYRQDLKMYEDLFYVKDKQ